MYFLIGFLIGAAICGAIYAFTGSSCASIPLVIPVIIGAGIWRAVAR